MQARFKVTIHKIKNKLIAGQRERRRLQACIRRRDAHILRLTKERDALKKQLAPTRVPNHHYPAEMIALAVFIVIHAKGSLRCAAKTVAFYAKLMGWEYGKPAHSMVDNWSRRLGLYALDHVKQKAGKYVAIIDESVQIGREKCLLLLGCKLEEEQSIFAPLRLCDVEVLGVEVQKSWKTDQVVDFVDNRLQQHPDLKIEYVISDQGRNLLSALSELGIEAVSDCSHVIMGLLKKCLAEYGPLKEMTAFMGNYRKQNTMSERSYLCPAALRAKDRFVRIFHVLDWVERIEKFWSQVPLPHQQTLAYIHTVPVQELLVLLKQLRTIISISTSILKTSGINLNSEQAWEDRIIEYTNGANLLPISEQLVDAIKKYFADHKEILKRHGRLLCCSDIIETTFGHYKNKGGMKVISSDVLYLPLLAHTIDLDFVKQGLTTVNQTMVDQWAKHHICENRYRVLQNMRKQAKTATAAA